MAESGPSANRRSRTPEGLRSRVVRAAVAAVAASAALLVVTFRGADPAAAAEESEPAAIVIGERLFLETRFAQHFAARSHGDVNAVVEPDPVMARVQRVEGSRRGPFAAGSMNCVACHAPPRFTDHAFHNTGVSQAEYDRAHGAGAFLALEVPTLAARNAEPSRWLPPTPERTDGLGVFASVPSAAAPGRADLGLWNVLFDPARTAPQARLRRLLAPPGAPQVPDETLLERAVAAFKTPTLRDLGQSAPYLHDGSADTIADAVRTYVAASSAARSGTLRNADPEMSAIRIDERDVHDLAAFLRSLAEDYE